MLSQNIRSSVSALLLSITSLVVIGIAGAQESSTQEKFKVGVSAPLTGDIAEYGTAVRQGIELAVSEDADSFSTIQFIFEDNQYEGSKAVTAFQKLTNIDAVRVIYNWGEPPLHSIAPIAEKRRIPVVAMSLDPSPSNGKTFLLRSINHSDQFASTLMDYFRKKGLKYIAIITTEDPFLNSMIAGLKRHLIEGETLEVFGTVTPDERDFKSQITRLKTRTFDVLGVYLFPGQVSQFYRQAKSLNLKIPTFGTDVFESRSEITQAQGGMDGAFYPHINVPKSFTESYLKRYGNDAQIAYAYNAYTFAKVTSVLFQGQKKQLTAEQIINSYANPPKNLGFTFTESIDGGRFYEFPIVVKQIHGSTIDTAS